MFAGAVRLWAAGAMKWPLSATRAANSGAGGGPAVVGAAPVPPPLKVPLRMALSSARSIIGISLFTFTTDGRCTEASYFLLK